MKKVVSVILVYLILHSCAAPYGLKNSNKFISFSNKNKNFSPALVSNKDIALKGASLFPSNADTNQTLEMGDNPKITSAKNITENISNNCDPSIINNYTSTSSKAYKNESGEVELFFDGVYVEYEFEQIGFIETIGNERTKTEELLDCLKSEAYNNGADAVISVKKEILLKDEDDKKYSVPSFNGVAIKYLLEDFSDSIEANKPMNQNNIRKEKPGFVQFLGVVGGSIIFAILIYLKISIEREDVDCCLY